MSENNDSTRLDSLSSLLSSDALGLIQAKGVNLIETVGLDVVRDVVFDVLTGRNIRNSTETLTRRRIVALNLSLIDFVSKGTKLTPDFVERLPHIAAQLLPNTTNKAERWLAAWSMGLTGKAIQNVLRDDRSQIPDYRDIYVETCKRLAAEFAAKYGEIEGSIKLASGTNVGLNWLVLAYLFSTVGSQTLTIRGSEKSIYGKFFEKLVLGSLLHILGLEYVPSGSLEKTSRVFWLASNSDRGRESDATILYEPGRGVRIDIGFIGRGNSEISLDKVSRYRREIDLGNRSWFMGTLIIVDRIGGRSRLPTLATEIEGEIVQMSAGYWPRDIALKLRDLVGLEHPLAELELDEIGDYLRERLATVPLLDFVKSTLSGVETSDDEE